MIKLQFKSLHSRSFLLYYKFLSQICNIYFKNYTRFVLPKKKKKITLLSSPHVNKVAREQFEITFYKSIFLIPISSSSSISDFKILLLNKPKNVSAKIKVY